MSLLNSIWTIFLYFFSWWIIPIAFLFFLRRKWGAWNIEAVILEKRGDNLIKTNDRLKKFYDKDSGLTKYKFLKCKDTIPVYNYDWILHVVEQPCTLVEKAVKFLRPTAGIAFLFRYGSKQYKPIKVTQDKSKKMQFKEIKDKNGEAIWKWDYAIFDPRWVVGVLDFEIIDWDNMNFVIQEQRSSDLRRRSNRDWLKTVLVPLAIILGAVLASLFILKFSADAGTGLRSSAPKPTEPSGGSKLMGGITDAFTPGQ